MASNKQVMTKEQVEKARNAPAIFSVRDGLAPQIADRGSLNVVLRSEPEEDGFALLEHLRKKHPEEFRKINFPSDNDLASINVYDFFDHKDASKHGVGMLQWVLKEISETNKRRVAAVQRIADFWKDCNPGLFLQHECMTIEALQYYGLGHLTMDTLEEVACYLRELKHAATEKEGFYTGQDLSFGSPPSLLNSPANFFGWVPSRQYFDQPTFTASSLFRTYSDEMQPSITKKLSKGNKNIPKIGSQSYRNDRFGKGASNGSKERVLRVHQSPSSPKTNGTHATPQFYSHYPLAWNIPNAVPTNVPVLTSNTTGAAVQADNLQHNGYVAGHVTNPAAAGALNSDFLHPIMYNKGTPGKVPTADAGVINSNTMPQADQGAGFYLFQPFPMYHSWTVSPSSQRNASNFVRQHRNSMHSSNSNHDKTARKPALSTPFMYQRRLSEGTLKNTSQHGVRRAPKKTFTDDARLLVDDGTQFQTRNGYRNVSDGMASNTSHTTQDRAGATALNDELWVMPSVGSEGTEADEGVKQQSNTDDATDATDATPEPQILQATDESLISGANSDSSSNETDETALQNREVSPLQSGTTDSVGKTDRHSVHKGYCVNSNTSNVPAGPKVLDGNIQEDVIDISVSSLRSRSFRSQTQEVDSVEGRMTTHASSPDEWTKAQTHNQHSGGSDSSPSVDWPSAEEDPLCLHSAVFRDEDLSMVEGLMKSSDGHLSTMKKIARMTGNLYLLSFFADKDSAHMALSRIVSIIEAQRLPMRIKYARKPRTQPPRLSVLPDKQHRIVSDRSSVGMQVHVNKSEHKPPSRPQRGPDPSTKLAQTQLSSPSVVPMTKIEYENKESSKAMENYNRPKATRDHSCPSTREGETETSLRSHTPTSRYCTELFPPPAEAKCEYSTSSHVKSESVELIATLPSAVSKRNETSQDECSSEFREIFTSDNCGPSGHHTSKRETTGPSTADKDGPGEDGNDDKGEAPKNSAHDQRRALGEFSNAQFPTLAEASKIKRTRTKSKTGEVQSVQSLAPASSLKTKRSERRTVSNHQGVTYRTTTANVAEGQNTAVNVNENEAVSPNQNVKLAGCEIEATSTKGSDAASPLIRSVSGVRPESKDCSPVPKSGEREELKLVVEFPTGTVASSDTALEHGSVSPMSGQGSQRTQVGSYDHKKERSSQQTGDTMSFPDSYENDTGAHERPTEPVITHRKKKKRTLGRVGSLIQDSMLPIHSRKEHVGPDLCAVSQAGQDAAFDSFSESQFMGSTQEAPVDTEKSSTGFDPHVADSSLDHTDEYNAVEGVESAPPRQKAQPKPGKGKGKKSKAKRKAARTNVRGEAVGIPDTPLTSESSYALKDPGISESFFQDHARSAPARLEKSLSVGTAGRTAQPAMISPKRSRQATLRVSRSRSTSDDQGTHCEEENASGYEKRDSLEIFQPSSVDEQQVDLRFGNLDDHHGATLLLSAGITYYDKTGRKYSDSEPSTTLQTSAYSEAHETGKTRLAEAELESEQHSVPCNRSEDAWNESLHVKGWAEVARQNTHGYEGTEIEVC